MIKKDILENLLSLYATKRNAEIMESEQLIDLLLKDKEFKQLEEEKRSLILEKGKLLFEKKDIVEIDSKINTIINEQENYLKQKNLTFQDLLPQFECKVCEDTGYKQGKMCSCLKQAFNNELMKNSNIDFDNVPLLKDYKLDAFDTEQQTNMVNVLDKLKIFVENFGNTTTKNITLVGKTGVGKTFLAKTIAKEVINKDFTCLFTSMFSLNNLFLKVNSSPEKDKIMELNNFIDTDLLIIDDLGTEPMYKNLTNEYLLLLICERVQNGKNTLFTTNLMPDKILDRYGERIYSRLMNKKDCVLFKIEGKDLRLSL